MVMVAQTGAPSTFAGSRIQAPVIPALMVAQIAVMNIASKTSSGGNLRVAHETTSDFQSCANDGVPRKLPDIRSNGALALDVSKATLRSQRLRVSVESSSGDTHSLEDDPSGSVEQEGDANIQAHGPAVTMSAGDSSPLKSENLEENGEILNSFGGHQSREAESADTVSGAFEGAFKDIKISGDTVSEASVSRISSEGLSKLPAEQHSEEAAENGDTLSGFETAMKEITLADESPSHDGTDTAASFEASLLNERTHAINKQDSTDSKAPEAPATKTMKPIDTDQPFTAYVAHMCKHPCLKSHPDRLVETSCLAAVSAPIITNKLCLPPKTLLDGLLTDAQLEVCLRASAQHELRLPDGRRRGFFIGDGAGVGKGRQQAGIIFENYLRGRRKAVWLSISADLIEDARRDTADIGGKDIKFHDLKNFKNDHDLSELGPGVLFCSYSLLVSKDRKNQIVQFCGEDFEGVLSLDEMHRAKNLGLEENEKSGGQKAGSKSALAVQWLQENLPSARVVYVSATGTTEPEHLACLSRLGLWGEGTAFENRDSFIQQVKSSGHGAMELVCMHMKAEGQYLARSLSFDEASFDLTKEDLPREFIDMYDAAAALWWDIIKAVEEGPKDRKRGSLLWGAHQRFFAQLCISAKINPTIEATRRALREGKCVVIGLQNTGESVACSEDNVAEDDEVSSTVNGIVRSFLFEHCDGIDPVMKQSFVDRLDQIDLPSNPLDDLIHKLGGPSKVAEMTGRKKRYVHSQGRWQYVSRVKEDVENAADTDSINIRERKKFQNGEKLVAIISQAASTGISLQADRRVKNQRRRVHITLQLPWSAEKAVQQLGRSHRSNQASAPEFKLMVSPIGGEWRFASAVANRLQSLGALTQGDRRAASGSSSLLPFSIDSKHGLNALKFLQTFAFKHAEPFPVPRSIVRKYGSVSAFRERAGAAMSRMGLDPKATCMGDKLNRFLNRLLGFPIQLQNDVFELFTHYMENDIEAAKKSKHGLSEGVSDIGGYSCVTKEEEWFKSSSGAVTKYFAISTERGVSWEEALRMHDEETDVRAGFHSLKTNRNDVVLARKALGAFADQQAAAKFHLVFPNIGYTDYTTQLTTLRESFHKVTLTPETMDGMRRRWEAMWHASKDKCGHRNELLEANDVCPGRFCTQEKRCVTHHVITGLVFPFWMEIERLLGGTKDEQAVNVVRVQLATGGRVVGLLIPEAYVDQVRSMICNQPANRLAAGAAKPRAGAAAAAARAAKAAEAAAGPGGKGADPKVPAALRGLAESGIWEPSPAAQGAAPAQKQAEAALPKAAPAKAPPAKAAPAKAALPKAPLPKAPPAKAALAKAALPKAAPAQVQPARASKPRAAAAAAAAAAAVLPPRDEEEEEAEAPQDSEEGSAAPAEELVAPAAEAPKRRRGRPPSKAPR